MTDPSPEDRSPRIPLVVAVLFAAMAVVGLWDIATDSPGIWRGIHGLVEPAFSLLGLFAAVVLGLGWVRAERSLAGVRTALERHRAERDRGPAGARRPGCCAGRPPYLDDGVGLPHDPEARDAWTGGASTDSMPRAFAIRPARGRWPMAHRRSSHT